MPAGNATPLSTARFQSGNAGETAPAAKGLAAKPGERDKFQREALLVVEQGKNLFLTGEAGAGKSHLLEHMRTHFPGKRFRFALQRGRQLRVSEALRSIGGRA